MGDAETTLITKHYKPFWGVCCWPDSFTQISSKHALPVPPVWPSVCSHPDGERFLQSPLQNAYHLLSISSVFSFHQFPSSPETEKGWVFLNIMKFMWFVSWVCVYVYWWSDVYHRWQNHPTVYGRFIGRGIGNMMRRYHQKRRKKGGQI